MRIVLGNKLFPVILFGVLIFLYNFQAFINFISPISFKWISIGFYIYISAVIFLAFPKRIQSDHFDWFFSLYLLFFLYTTTLVTFNLTRANFVCYFNINTPFLVYTYIKSIHYDKNLEKFFKLNTFFLSIVVFYGIYEYFFAQDALRLFCINVSGRVDELDFPYSFYYRSYSFVMNFVHFSYYGLLLCFIYLIRGINRHRLIHFVLLLLAFTGLLCSVGFTSIGLFLCISICYVILFGNTKQRILCVFVGVILTCIFFYLYMRFKEEFSAFQRLNMIFTEGETGHNFIFPKDLFQQLTFLGTGKFLMVHEQEYFDAWLRFGVIMGTIYLFLTFTVYYRIFKNVVLFREMNLINMPLLLFCIANMIIGFVHHTLDNINQSILIFAFIAMLENRYKKIYST